MSSDRRISSLFSWVLFVLLSGTFGPSWTIASHVKATTAEVKSKAKPSALSADQKQANLESFDFVWETVRDKHYDPDLGGLDWNALKDQYRPQVEAAETLDEARDAMRALLNELGQSHFGIISRRAYNEISDTDRDGDGVTGIEVRIVDGKALVVAVQPNSPAEKAGVRPGWIIEAVSGDSVEPALEKAAEAFGDSNQYQLRASRVIEARLGGKVGADREIQFRDGDDEPVELKLKLVRETGQRASFGNLPAMYVHFESRKLEDQIAYVTFNAFFDPIRLMPALETVVRDNLEAEGFIIDLRGNPGGIGAMAMGMANWFVDEPGHKLGTMTTRDGSLHFTLNGRPLTYKGPLAILIDGCSASTSEILVGGLKDLGRARVFGTKTAGAALPSIIARLANGDGFQYAFANYVSSGGEVLEGQGVEPDEVIEPSREKLLEGKDPVLNAAVNWITSQARARE